MTLNYAGVRHGFSFEAWLQRVHDILIGRLDSEERVTLLLAHQPLWDYWSSGYNPQDAAEDMAPTE
jgi:hypothetical protein